MKNIHLIWIMLIIVAIMAFIVPYQGAEQAYENFCQSSTFDAYDDNILYYGEYDDFKPYILPDRKLIRYRHAFMDPGGRIKSLQNEVTTNQLQLCEQISCPSMFPNSINCWQCPKWYSPVV